MTLSPHYVHVRCDKCSATASDSDGPWPQPNGDNDALPAGWSHVVSLKWIGHDEHGRNDPWEVERYHFCTKCKVLP